MDADGMPLTFYMNPGATNEQITMRPLEEKILKDFDLSQFIVVTDADLSSAANKRLNMQGERHFITTQSIKKLKEYLREWALDKSGWMRPGSSAVFDLEGENTAQDVKQNIYSSIFYKIRRTNDTDVTGEKLEQNFIVTFSFKYRDYQKRSGMDRSKGQ